MAGTVTRLSSVDAAWLKMEDPTNLMMVTGVLTFTGPLDFRLFKSLIAGRLLQFERFSQRVVRPSLPFVPPYWEFDPHFNLNAHLHHVALPHPGDKAALQEMVSDQISTALDFSKPLWQMHVVEGYGDGGALIVRLHHSMADGMAVVGVLLALTELAPESTDWPANGDLPENISSTGWEGSLQALRQQADTFFDTSIDLGRRTLIEGLESYLNPDRPRQLAELGSDYAYAASKLMLRAPDPPTAFKGPLGISKRVAWSRPLPLSEVKAMRRATGATINDLMVAAVTGSLRRYLEKRGEEVVDVRAAVPVNLRSPAEMGEMGNKFGFVFLDLPVTVSSIKERLATIRHRMENLKESQEAPVSLDILSGMGLSPQMIQDIVVRIIGAKATAVLTNIPGPPIPLFLAGQAIESLMFWVPQSGRLGLGISLTSYAGNISLGVATDSCLVPHPDEIVQGFYSEYDELLALI
jgi:diacylglycerol O-acyltransferase / wax synthase